MAPLPQRPRVGHRDEHGLPAVQPRAAQQGMALLSQAILDGWTGSLPYILACTNILQAL